jgi:hypothetical protein
MRRDHVVDAHYAPLRVDRIRRAAVSWERSVFVSYRKKDAVYWTARRVQIPAGEATLTDGVLEIRARCGNRISEVAQDPILAEDPSEQELEDVEAPLNVAEAPGKDPTPGAPQGPLRSPSGHPAAAPRTPRETTPFPVFWSVVGPPLLSALGGPPGVPPGMPVPFSAPPSFEPPPERAPPPPFETAPDSAPPADLSSLPPAHPPVFPQHVTMVSPDDPPVLPPPPLAEPGVPEARPTPRPPGGSPAPDPPNANVFTPVPPGFENFEDAPPNTPSSPGTPPPGIEEPPPVATPEPGTFFLAIPVLLVWFLVRHRSLFPRSLARRKS